MQQGGPPYGVLPPQHQQQAELSPFHLVGAGGAAEAAPPISARPPPPPGTGAPSNYEELGAGDDPLGPPGDEGGSAGLTGNRWPRQETLALLKIRSDMDATFRDATLKGPLWEEVSRKLGELGYRRSAKKCKEKFENVHKYYKRTKEGRAGRQDGKSYRFFSQLEALHNTTAANTNPSPLSSAPQSMATTLTALAPNNQTPDPNPNQSGTAATRTMHPMQISTPTPITTAPPNPQTNPMRTLSENPNVPGSAAAGYTAAGIGFSSNTSSSAGSESEDDDGDDDEATEEGPCSGRKRKRESGGGGSKKMMSFFEGLMRQVMERQESMQRRFLEAIEKREQDRMIRDEAWRRQEMSRAAREHELASQERAAAASRDAAIISFLQKVTGQTVQLPPPPLGVSSSPATTTTVIQTPQNPPPPSQIHQPPLQPPPQQQQQQSTEAVRYHRPITPPAQQPSTEAVRHRQPITPPAQQPSTEAVRHHQAITPPAPQPSTESVRHHEAITPPPPPPPASSELCPVGPSEAHEGAIVSVSLDPASSRWPKSEVHALIKLRSELDSRYQDSGPKGPLWEEISAGMQRLGYNRSSKRCKEKWENINKYFKKVKESNKKRPEDAKTCPYFHQLDALYRNKHINNSGGGGGGSSGGGGMPVLTLQNSNPNPSPSPITIMAPPQVQYQGEMDSKSGNGGNADQNSAGSSNGGIESNFFGEGTSNRGGGDNGGIMKKPEDIMKELMGHSTSNYGNLNEPKSDNIDEDDEEEDDEGDEDGKGQYRIQFQNVGNNAGNGASPNTGGKTAGTFLAMVR